MTELAISYQAAGRIGEAIELETKALALKLKHLPQEHSWTTKSLENLATYYEKAGRKEDAKKLRDTLENPTIATPLDIQADFSPEDTELAMRVAARQAWLGQETNYLATCRRMLQWAESTQELQDAERVAKLASLHPTADHQIASAALKLARRAVDLGQNDTDLLPWNELALGMAEYRNGHYPQVDEALRSAVQRADGSSEWKRYRIRCTAGFYQAMALFQIGKAAEAKSLFASTEAAMKPLPDDAQSLPAGVTHDDVIVWLAYKEAKALLNVDTSTKP